MASRPKNITCTVSANIRIYEEKPSGIQNFIQGLFSGFIKRYPNYTFILFSTGEKKIESHANYVIADSMILRWLKKINPLLMNIFFDNIYILRYIFSSKPDIFIAPSYILPLLKPRRTKYISVIHDLSYLTYKHNPFNLYMNYVMYMKLVMPFVIRRADMVVTPSVYVKNHIKKTYQLDESKMTVIYEGMNEFFHRQKNANAFHKVKNKYGISGKYCFTTATNHERKNIYGLLTAFSKSSHLSKTQLVIAGLLPDETIAQIQTEIKKLGLTKKIKYVGYVSQEELRLLYSYAILFVFPSFEEGFGLPILEAANCGCLPIASHTGALPEVIGNERLLFNPRSTRSIVDKIDEVLHFTPSRYKKELSLVQQHIKKFTWQKTADDFAVLCSSLAK